MRNFSRFGLLLVLFGTLLGGAGGCASWKRKALCPEIEFVGEKPRFDESETKLLCGDPEIDAWKDIPTPQVEIHLKSFLLERGYYAPEITAAPRDDAKTLLRVKLGPVGILKKLQVEDWPLTDEVLPPDRFVGQKLTPSLLNEIESQALIRLRSRGYPCAKAQSMAKASEGLVVLRVQSSAPFTFGQVERTPVKNFDSAVLSRFEAFAPEQPYDVRLLTLSERRIRLQGLVQDVAYVPTCNGDGFQINEHSFVGDSRLLTLGVGFDTEELFIARARFSAVRLSSLGARLNSVLRISWKLQTLDSSLEWPFGRNAQRQDLFLNALVKREAEDDYATISLAGRAGWKRRFEAWNSALETRVNALLERVWVVRGVGPDVARALGLELSFDWSSHLFEYYSADPQAGFKASLLLQGTAKTFLSSFSSVRAIARLEGVKVLWERGRASVIWSHRFAFSGVAAPDNERGLIPPDRLFYLGGSQDLRGFGRKELPRQPVGAFTSVYGGFELRLARIWPIEPFVFWDLGSVGLGEGDEKFPLYHSPGLGLRWNSPIGTLRGTAAYGFASRPRTADRGHDHAQYFLSLGEEF